MQAGVWAGLTFLASASLQAGDFGNFMKRRSKEDVPLSWLVLPLFPSKVTNMDHSVWLTH